MLGFGKASTIAQATPTVTAAPTTSSTTTRFTYLTALQGRDFMRDPTAAYGAYLQVS
jgi:hypothetical protein